VQQSTFTRATFANQGPAFALIDQKIKMSKQRIV